MNINATLFVQMAVFFVGAWITMKFIWPPLNRAIEERQKKIADGLAAADRGEHALEEAKKEGASIEAAARAQSQVIVAQGEKRGQAIIEEAKAQAQVEADKIIAAARAQAAQEEEEEELIVGEVEEGVNRNQVLIGDGDEGDDDFEFL